MKRAWQIGNILALLFALVANAVVGAQLIDVPAINEISDRYATVLTPATYAFSIWSVIYLLLVVFTAYQARDIFRPQQKNDLPQKIGPYFIISSICNGLWTYVFVQEYIALSVGIIILLNVALYRLIVKVRAATYDADAPTIAFVWWPLLVYTGWTTVACVVAIASWLRAEGIAISPGAGAATLAVLAVALLILLVKRNVRELLLASSWGIIAIGVQQAHMAAGSRLMAVTAFGAGGILLAATVLHAYKNRQANFLVKLRQR